MKAKKIYILGGTGSGKTTLAEKLSNILKIKHYSTDNFVYKKKWSISYSKEQKEKNIEKITKNKKWIIEGVHADTWCIPTIKKADLIIFIDKHRFSLFSGVLKRELKLIGYKKDTIKSLPKLLYYAYIYKKGHRHKHKNSLKQAREFIILKNNKEINQFVLKFQDSQK